MMLLEEHIEQMSIGERFLWMLASWVLTFWSTFVVMKLWGWFMVPIGLPHISFFLVMGMILTVRYLTWQLLATTKKVGSILEYYIGQFLYASFVLFQAWLITLFL